MIHDPMCPSFDGSDNHYCECDLIARVREDEAWRRGCADGRDDGVLVGRDQILATLGQETP